MRITLLLLACFSCKIISAQAFGWAKTIGTTSVESASAVTHDASGNVYVAGYFSTTTDFNPGSGVLELQTTGVQSYTGFVMKLNADGNLVWAKAFPGQAMFCTGIAVDADSNVYTSGSFELVTDFDPGPGVFNLNGSSGRTYISKLDSNGNFAWAKMLSGASNSAKSIEVRNNHVVLGGSFFGTVDFDPGPGTHSLTSLGNQAIGHGDAFVLKLDTLGNFVQVKRLGGGHREFLGNLATDQDGNIYVNIGYRSADFDPGSGTLPFIGTADNMLVAKFDSELNCEWSRTIANNWNSESSFVCIDNEANVFVSGTYTATTDVDPGPAQTYFPGSGIFTLKLDNSGELLWAKNASNNGSALVDATGCDAQGNFYMLASASNLTFGTGTDAVEFFNFGNETLYCKYNAQGDFLWVLPGYKNSNPYMQAMSVAQDGAMYICGDFDSTSDFDPTGNMFNATPVGLYDIFVCKLTNEPLGIDAVSGSTPELVISEQQNAIRFSANTQMSLAIFDIMGRKIETLELNENNNFCALSFSQLASGTYVVNGSSGGISFSRKFFKK